MSRRRIRFSNVPRERQRITFAYSHSIFVEHGRVQSHDLTTHRKTVKRGAVLQPANRDQSFAAASRRVTNAPRVAHKIMPRRGARRRVNRLRAGNAPMRRRCYRLNDISAKFQRVAGRNINRVLAQRSLAQRNFRAAQLHSVQRFHAAQRYQSFAAARRVARNFLPAQLVVRLETVRNVIVNLLAASFPVNRHVKRFRFENVIRQRQRVTVASQLNGRRRGWQRRICQRNSSRNFARVKAQRDARHGIIFNREIRKPLQRETRSRHRRHVGNRRAFRPSKTARFAVRSVNQTAAALRPTGIGYDVLRDAAVENDFVAAIDRNIFRANVRRIERERFGVSVNNSAFG